MSDTTTCGWRCGDTTPNHGHFAVVVRENGRLLGRLCPDGTTARNKIYAAVLSNATATTVADQINASGDFAAKVVPF